MGDRLGEAGAVDQHMQLLAIARLHGLAQGKQRGRVTDIGGKGRMV